MHVPFYMLKSLDGMIQFLKQDFLPRKLAVGVAAEEEERVAGMDVDDDDDDDDDDDK